MKDPSGLLGKIYLTILKMHEVVMQTAEPVSTKRRYWNNGKNLYSIYAKVYLEHLAANATQINADHRTQLLGILK